MYRSFLSWRYLRHRPTNLIGMVGIFVAVGALILILSIMTGFLEETRRAVRGGLADLLIEPWSPDAELLDEPGPILAHLGRTPGVEGGAAQLRYYGILTLTGRDAGFSRSLLQSASYGNLSIVEIVGVDVRTPERLLRRGARAVGAFHGLPVAFPPIHDELDTTDFLRSLLRVGELLAEDKPTPGAPSSTPVPVQNPLMPFHAEVRGERRAIAAVRPYPGVVVGSTLAHQLSLRRGEVVQLATAIPGQDGTPVGHGPESAGALDQLETNNREFVVAGTFQSSENETNLGRIYMAREQLADFLGNTSTFSQILVRLEDYHRDGERLRDQLRVELRQAGLLAGTTAAGEVRTWEEFRGNLLGAIENERLLMGIMLSLVMVVAGFTVFAILSMMVTEKRRDIGILCALGATRSGVLHTFLWIAFWDALVGALLGAAAGVWAALKIDAIEQWLSRTLGFQIFNRDVYLFDHIPTVVIPYAVALIVLGAFVCALLFAAIPAWRAARLDPLEALRYE